MSRNVSKCLSKCLEMSLNVSKCLKMSQNVSKCLEMSRNVSKCLEMSGPIWSYLVIKVQIKKGDKSPKRKRKYKSKQKREKSKLAEEKKKSFLRPRCEIAVKKCALLFPLSIVKKSALIHRSLKKGVHSFCAPFFKKRLNFFWNGSTTKVNLQGQPLDLDMFLPLQML